jgi:hypothetical protein
MAHLEQELVAAASIAAADEHEGLGAVEHRAHRAVTSRSASHRGEAAASDHQVTFEGRSAAAWHHDNA